LPQTQPTPSDYAEALGSLLHALGIDRVHLVGHSMGTLVAARFAAENPERMLSLTLASVTTGFGNLPANERDEMIQQRLEPLSRLGPAGLASIRAPYLLGPNATTEMVAAVTEVMA
jgi:pimeloyl-ACP methyl ester carboxylesterase